MCGGGLWLSSSGLALLLRTENLALNIRKMVGLGLAPLIPRFLLGVKSCHLFFGQLFPGQQSSGPRSIFVQTILGIGGVFSVILLLQLLYFFRLALAACKGKSDQKKNGINRIEILLKTSAGWCGSCKPEEAYLA